MNEWFLAFFLLIIVLIVVSCAPATPGALVIW